MPDIPPEILPILTDLEIQEPSQSRWKRLEDRPTRPGRSHHFCPCGNREDGQQQVDMTMEWLGNRRVFIGQCRWCLTVYWRDAVKM